MEATKGSRISTGLKGIARQMEATNGFRCLVEFKVSRDMGAHGSSCSP